MLSVEDGEVESSSFSFGKKKDFVPAKIYNLTEMGEKEFSTYTTTGFVTNKRSGFCIGNFKVKEVKNFSNPSEMRGYTISHVNYTFSAENIVDWAKSEKIKDAFSSVRKNLDGVKEDNVTLILMNDGWVHEREMKM